MSSEVYQAIARASSGFVESPAGCGKTEAIVKTIGAYCDDPQLVLTHTNAGVDALRRRFREHQVPANKYHVDTIAGWAWGWVRKYPGNAGYGGPADIVEWNIVYAAMTNLLQKRFVKQGILNSYAGLIVDEYQDCTVPMHTLIVELMNLLPCRVLGDELQGVFGFRDDPLVAWSDVQRAFKNNLGALETPHRWIKVGNMRLGQWLLDARPAFLQEREPDYAGSPVERRAIPYSEVGKELLRLTTEKKGRICVVGPKARRLLSGTETTLVNRGYRVLEPNDLSALRTLILALSDGPGSQQADAAMKFLTVAYGGIETGDKTFIGKILNGQRQQPHRADRRILCETHREGITPRLLIDLLRYIEELPGVSCKLRESVSALKCILEGHLESSGDLKSLYADEIAKRKYQNRRNAYRCVGSTLLIKGLEFDHAMILRDPNWRKSWGNHKDLYVALTRGSKSVTLMDLRA